MNEKKGKQPVKKLLITMSLTIMVAMYIQAVYNIIDSVFVANYSKQALEAVSVAFPISMIIIAISVGTAVGMGALLAKTLGQKKIDKANNVFLHGVLLAILSWLALAIFGLIFADKFSAMFTTNPQTITDAALYIRITTIGSFGIFLQIMMERVFQSTGKTVLNLIMQSSGALINIILDPILIFGMFGLPAMGVKGAAIATIIGQIIAMIIGYVLIKKKIPLIKVSLKEFKFDFDIVKKIYQVGFPAIIMQSIVSLTTVCLNYILAMNGETAISVYSIYAKLQQFVFMPIFGLNNAMVAIIAYNYGAKNKLRIQQTIRFGLILTTIIMAFGFILFQLTASNILILFNADQAMFEIGIPALKIISLAFIPTGISIVACSVFQALGKGFLSLSISALRNILLLVPLCYLLYVTFGLPTMWYSFVIAESMCLVYSIYLMIKINKTIINPLQASDAKDDCRLTLETA